MLKVRSFLVNSQRLVPVFFYVAVPLLLRKSGLSFTWILLPVMILLLGYWLIRRKFYRATESTGRFMLDALVMTFGLGVLYFIEIHFYSETDTLNFVVYFFAFLSYAPALLTTHRMDSEGKRIRQQSKRIWSECQIFC